MCGLAQNRAQLHQREKERIRSFIEIYVIKPPLLDLKSGDVELKFPQEVGDFDKLCKNADK